MTRRLAPITALGLTALWLTALGLIVLALVPTGLAAQAAPTGPVASPLEPVKDVGAVQQGRNITHRFQIRNDGDAPLELIQVKPSCGCTVVEFDARIAAGETGVIKAVLDTSKFSGPIAKSISVYTNDGENPRIVLVLKADIRTHLEATPTYARFLTVVGESVPSVSVTLWATDIEDLEIRRVESPFPFLVASLVALVFGAGLFSVDGCFRRRD